MGGASLKENRFQRAIACRVFPAGRIARRIVFDNCHTNYYRHKLISEFASARQLIFTIHAAQLLQGRLFARINLLHAIAQ